MIRRTIALASLAAVLAAGGGILRAQPQDHSQHHGGMSHAPGTGPHQPWHGALQAAIAAPTRTPANTARDKYRHPFETLAFFGVKPTDNVVEIWPSGGWYTEILAPYLAQGGGSYWAASMGANGNAGMQKLMTANPSAYGKIRLAAFPAFEAGETQVPDGSADVVLTFRNVHNWIGGYRREGKGYEADAFSQMYRMLKPGGTLGIVDHRLPEGAESAREKSSGYVKVSTVRRLAEAAGFHFAGASEVNANPKDTADWPNGVWTLPPSLSQKDQDRERYLAIGESDRMTLKFVKPR
jgi:predicted methyltransferase